MIQTEKFRGYVVAQDPYDVADQRNASKHYKGWVYTVLCDGKTYKPSSAVLDLSKQIEAAKGAPLPGTGVMELNPQEKGIKLRLISWDPLKG